MARIAVLNKDRCKPDDCGTLCMRVCPKVKTGDEAITIDEETGKPVISEVLCTGCGICIKKCPFDAITIVNLPEELGDPVHEYGTNGFRLFNLPTPQKGVVGIVGSNGIGKSTVSRILAGEMQPNLGSEANWDQLMEKFKGQEIQSYLQKLADGEIQAVYKPQYVEAIPRLVDGEVKEILEERNDAGRMDWVIDSLAMESFIEKNVQSLSGGELQKLAIAVSLIQDADIYLLDEPSSYLDVKERLNMARAVRELEDKYVMVIEHDLVVLDYLSDYIHVMFGKPGAYGIVSTVKGVRVGVNEYLKGYLSAENMRFRDEITFNVSSPTDSGKEREMTRYPKLEKTYPGFELKVDEGGILRSEVVGILGPNATGKTTFVKMLAEAEQPDNQELDLGLSVSYKPQYIPKDDSLVIGLGLDPFFVEKLSLKYLMQSKISDLSGGELQRVAIADCLSKNADLYLLDEPSAYLDVEERLKLAKELKRFAEEKKVSVLVVDHDILLVDYLSDHLMVFSGESGVNGHASSTLSLREGMNRFLSELGITFRRDPDTKRPRANKPESVKDRQQKKEGRYYYT